MKLRSRCSNIATKELDKKSFISQEVIGAEEGYLLVFDSVSYYYQNKKFITLNNNFTLDDLVQEVYCTFLQRKSFDKFNSTKASKKTYVLTLTRNCLIDILRTFKETFTFSDTFVESEDTEENADRINNLAVEDDFTDKYFHAEVTRQFLEFIKTVDKINTDVTGINPLTGKSMYLCQRTVLELLLCGYSLAEITRMFSYKETKKSISTTPVRNILKHLKENAKYSIPYLAKDC